MENSHKLSNQELVNIVGQNRFNYHPSVVLEAEKELTNRNVWNEKTRETFISEGYANQSRELSENILFKVNNNDFLGNCLMFVSIMLFLSFYGIPIGVITYISGIAIIIKSQKSTHLKVIWISFPIITWLLIVRILLG
jgi:hypothetical protein